MGAGNSSPFSSGELGRQSLEGDSSDILAQSPNAGTSSANIGVGQAPDVQFRMLAIESA
jgi:hypothetical protein